MRRATTPGEVGRNRGGSEKEFQAQILELARLAGWKAYHTHDSRRSRKGFPDLVLVRPPEIVFAELKTDSPSAKLRPEQRAWLEALSECPGVEARLWRPGDFEDMQAMLCERRKGA